MPSTNASPRPVPSPDLLRREERLEQVRLHLGGHPGSVVGHAQPAYSPGATGRVGGPFEGRSSRARTSTPIAPPDDIASRALITRLMTTCSRSDGSIIDAAPPLSSSSAHLDVFADDARQHLAEAAPSCRPARRARSAVVSRPNAMSCRVSARRARSPADLGDGRLSSSPSRREAVDGTSVYPIVTWSRLLKLCARCRPRAGRPPPSSARGAASPPIGAGVRQRGAQPGLAVAAAPPPRG